MILLDPNFKLEKHSSMDLNTNYVANKKTLLGFWLYLMSDCIMFSAMFAVYEVLISYYSYDDFLYKKIFNLPLVFLETIILLLSSFSFGMAMINFLDVKKKSVSIWLFNTFWLGLSFIIIEFCDFLNLLKNNFSPHTSSFFSSYFALIGFHGIHILVGLIWILVILFQLNYIGLGNVLYTRLKCLGLFWHFLDIIWICIFTFVYLIGV